MYECTLHRLMVTFGLSLYLVGCATVTAFPEATGHAWAGRWEDSYRYLESGLISEDAEVRKLAYELLDKYPRIREGAKATFSQDNLLEERRHWGSVGAIRHKKRLENYKNTIASTGDYNYAKRNYEIIFADYLRAENELENIKPEYEARDIERKKIEYSLITICRSGFAGGLCVGDSTEGYRTHGYVLDTRAIGDTTRYLFNINGSEVVALGYEGRVAALFTTSNVKTWNELTTLKLNLEKDLYLEWKSSNNFPIKISAYKDLADNIKRNIYHIKLSALDEHLQLEWSNSSGVRILAFHPELRNQVLNEVQGDLWDIYGPRAYPQEESSAKTSRDAMELFNGVPRISIVFRPDTSVPIMQGLIKIFDDHEYFEMCLAEAISESNVGIEIVSTEIIRNQLTNPLESDLIRSLSSNPQTVSKTIDYFLLIDGGIFNKVQTLDAIAPSMHGAVGAVSYEYQSQLSVTVYDVASSRVANIFEKFSTGKQSYIAVGLPLYWGDTKPFKADCYKLGTSIAEWFQSQLNK